MSKYDRQGADGKEQGLYVRFEPGFGLNVYTGHRYRVGSWDAVEDRQEFGMSIDGWERLCELVDEWRAAFSR